MFAELNAAVSDFRSSLRAFFGETALEELNVRPPAGDDDEASFLKLISWAYALLFEAGRITIPFLLELPSNAVGLGRDTKEARKLVHALRTWSSHNLGFGNERDVDLQRHVQRWFIDTCGANPPNDEDCWRKCSHELCAAVLAVVHHCQGAVTLVLAGQDDGDGVIKDLHKRLTRAWPGHEFDKLVGDAATRLGMSIDPRKFRESRLVKWRSFLECVAEEDDPEIQMTRLIERDLLDYAAQVLPIDGRDVMEILGIGPGPDVAKALYQAKELCRSGINDREILIQELIKAWGRNGEYARQ